MILITIKSQLDALSPGSKILLYTFLALVIIFFIGYTTEKVTDSTDYSKDSKHSDSTETKFATCNLDKSDKSEGIMCLGETEKLSITIMKFHQISNADIMTGLEDFLGKETKENWKNEYFVVQVTNNTLKTERLDYFFLRNFKVFSNEDEVDFEMKISEGDGYSVEILSGESVFYYAKAILPKERTITEIQYKDSLSSPYQQIIYDFTQ
ncbi:MAG: hypothetical protein COT90_01950 [Candidatus Diapherotrites archaeon CG10_big_fil_rev_8_21_14_0_10_31_34]|nr:MAG: hypothetical protein COT90_01950 [Candidatus Diapherotrites archaeon CG10_big_fil_rev_8_21_14_0_10_31_34]